MDRAGLDAALSAGIAVGGFMPKGARAEDGTVPLHYRLLETATPDYAGRTVLNIEHSDATLILHDGTLTGGTLLTLTCCKRLAKPVLSIKTGDKNYCRRRIREFLSRTRPAVLNIAGPRESKAPGIYLRAMEVLTRIFIG